VQGTTGATSTNGTTVNGTSINTRPNGSTSSFVGAPASFNNPPVPSSVSKPADQTLTVSSMVGELQNANIQSINTTINVSNILTGTSMRSIDTELSANPAAVRQAERLTEILRTRGVIGSGQRVVGIYNGQAVVALTSTLTK
jgi:hypothetical protein